MVEAARTNETPTRVGFFEHLTLVSGYELLFFDNPEYGTTKEGVFEHSFSCLEVIQKCRLCSILGDWKQDLLAQRWETIHKSMHLKE